MTVERNARDHGSQMFRRVKDLQRYTIAAQDGDIGTVDDVYFDDQSWTVRHIVVDTGAWLTDGRVLIPPRAIQAVDAVGERLVTHLTRSQVESAPPIGTERPVSRQYETDLYGHYGYPYYWAGPYRWGLSAYPYSAMPYPAAGLGAADGPAVAGELEARERAREDSNLRSARDVSGHAIQASDGRLGHVEDYLIEMETWAIRYLIVDPRDWWPGHHVLVSTEWIRAVHWNDSTVQVDLSREAVRNAPAYDPSMSIDRDFETEYHRAHGRPEYWRKPDAGMLQRPAA